MDSHKIEININSTKFIFGLIYDVFAYELKKIRL